MSQPRIAVIGAGVMGAQHARVIAASPRAELAAILDEDSERAAALADGFGVAHEVLGGGRSWDAAILATPTETHEALAAALLADGVPLLVEKPLAHTLDGVKAIVAAAEAAGVPLMCGFVERFNPVVGALFELLDEPPLHVVAVRHSPRADRITTSVVHDLLVHDIDLAVHLCGGVATDVAAVGWVSTVTETYEIVDASFRIGATVVTCSADRWNQRKIRTLEVTTETKLIELDLLRHDVTVYRHVRHEIGSTTYRAETVVDIPFVRHHGEPLAVQLEHFVDLLHREADADAERLGLVEPHVIAARVDECLATGGR